MAGGVDAIMNQRATIARPSALARARSLETISAVSEPAVAADSAATQLRDSYGEFGLVRSRGLEPPRVAPLPPQGSASTNSATTAVQRTCNVPVANSPAAHKLSTRGRLTYQTLRLGASRPRT